MPLRAGSISTGIWKYICCLIAAICTVGLINPAHGLGASDRTTRIIALPTTEMGATESERTELRSIYEGSGHALIWASTWRQLVLVKLLASLESDGIDLDLLGASADTEVLSQARGDVLATRTVLRAAHIIAAGAVKPESIPGWSLDPPNAPIVAVFLDAMRNNHLETLFDSLRPATSAYRDLRLAYVRYLHLEVEAWPPLDTSTEVRVDTNDARAAEIIRRLTLLGDLREGETSNSVVTNAVKRFQNRHGLTVDGRIGSATLAAFNVPPAARAEQIAANLEYWRLLPRIWPKRFVSVNTAAAELELISEGEATYTSRVIVGDSKHPTPVIAAKIHSVTFNPSWTIPYSIASKEILPRLRREPDYLQRNNIQILGRPGDPYGLQIDWRLYSRAAFPFQLRQTPGPHNALGLIKFEMPNDFDVYLHDTPDKSLFAKSSRALSHGCVRVECANELAQRVIDNPSIWLQSDLAAALTDGRTVTVPLTQSLPVYFLYFTTYTDDEGVLNFRQDVYGRDRAVDAAVHALSSRDPTAAGF